MSTIFDELLQLEYLVHWLFLPELCFTYPCLVLFFLHAVKERSIFMKFDQFNCFSVVHIYVILLRVLVIVNVLYITRMKKTFLK